MISNTKPTAKLYLLVCVMSLFIIGIGLLGIREMKAMSLNTQTLYTDRIFPLQQLTEIRYAYATGVLALSEELENHAIRPEQATVQLANAKKIIDENWKTYQKTFLTKQEAELVKQTDVLKSKADKAIDELMANILSSDANIYRDIVDEKMYVAINPVIEKINELVQLQITISNDLAKTNTMLHTSAATKIYVLIAGSLLFAGLLAFFIIGDTRNLISDLKTSNRKIKEAEEKCRAFIRYAGDSIFILDKNLNITDVNDSACSLLGYSEKELQQMKIADLMPSDEQVALPEKIDAIKKEGRSLHERKWQRKDGSFIDTEVNIRVLEDVGYVSIIRDITERKKAALEIKESEQKYRYLFQNSPACIIIWDLETLRVLEVNDTVIDRYGYSKEEWKNMSVLQYRLPEDHERIKASVQSMLRGNQPISGMRWKHLKKNGEEMLMEVTSHKIIYNNRQAIMSLGSDMTDHFNAQVALSKSEEKFHSLVDHAADAIFMVADDGIIFDVNRSATDLLYYSKDELIGRTVLDLHPPEVRKSIPKVWETLRKNQSYTDERWLQRKDGTWVEVEIVRNMLPDGSGAIAIVRDITERKKVEDALYKSNEQYSQLFNHMLNGLMVCELIYDEKGEPVDHRFVQANPAFERLTGVSIKAEVGKTGKEISIGWPPDVIQRLYRVALTGEPIEYERYNETLGRTYATRVFSPRKGLFAHTFTDVTERKKAEANLRQSEEKHRALIENISDGIILVNENWNITYQSPSVERIVGFTLADRTGKTAIDFIHPDDVRICAAQYENARDRPGIPVQSVYRSRHKQGFYIWIEVFLMNLLNNNNIQSYVVIYRDITERKKFEEQQQLMASIVNSSDDAIISKTMDGKITSWNYGAEKILGYAAKDMIGQPISIIIPPHLPGEENEIVRNISMGKSIDHYETKRVKKDGEIIDVSITVSPIYDAQGAITGASKILRDITKEKASEERLALQNRELVKTNAELDRFVYSTSHDLRAPLKSLLGLISIMKRSAGPDDKVQETRLELMNKSVIKLDNFIEDILRYSKNTRMEIANEEIIFEDLIRDITESHKFIDGIKELNFQVLVKQDVKFATDKRRLNVVLNNIISNAIKYKDELKKESSFVKIHVQCSQQNAVIIVEDNGIGISESDQEKIFEMFYRATTLSNGSGLGMYIVKETLDKLNGKIKMESVLAKGTTFMIEIPNRVTL